MKRTAISSFKMIYQPRSLLRINSASAFEERAIAREHLTARCPVCGKTFRGPHCKGVLSTHINTIHLKVKSWHCVFCARVFFRNDSRRRHQLTCFRNPDLGREAGGGGSETVSDEICKYCHQRFGNVKKRAAHEWRCGRS